jgi:hypothetical protein
MSVCVVLLGVCAELEAARETRMVEIWVLDYCWELGEHPINDGFTVHQFVMLVNDEGV